MKQIKRHLANVFGKGNQNVLEDKRIIGKKLQNLHSKLGLETSAEEFRIARKSPSKLIFLVLKHCEMISLVFRKESAIMI